jgi:hypothetical protein
VFVQCALKEEADAIVRIFANKRKPSSIVTQQLSNQYPFILLAVQSNVQGDPPLKVGVGWQPEQGPSATYNYIGSIKHVLTTRMWLMSGICAGVEQDVGMGDVIVAVEAVEKGGKMTHEGRLKAKSERRDITDLVRSWALAITEADWHRHLLLPYPNCTSTTPAACLPPRLIWCVRDILNRLHEAGLVFSSNLSTADAKARWDTCKTTLSYTNDRRSQVLQYAQKKGWITRYNVITESGLKFLNDDRDHHNIDDPYPVPERSIPKSFHEAMFSSEYVREDLPKVIEEIRVSTANRTVRGADMEIFAFYDGLKDLLGGTSTHVLAVKGVCDYGDEWKDDYYHEIAAENAAAWLLEFVKRHGKGEQVHG